MRREGEIRSSAGETQLRLHAASPSRWEAGEVDPARVREYWERVSGMCVPPWLQEFDPGERLLERLHNELISSQWKIGEG